MIAAIVIAALIVQRLAELRVASRNEKWAREQGGIEHGADHYWMFVAMHTTWFVSMLVEHFLRGQPIWDLWWLAAVILIATQGLRYWAISSLGRYWNTKIIVVPGASIVTAGPYKYMRHPNYIAVVLELAFVPALLGAWYTAAAFTILNAIVLLTIRIPAEEAALESLNEKSPFD